MTREPCPNGCGRPMTMHTSMAHLLYGGCPPSVPRQPGCARGTCAECHQRVDLYPSDAYGIVTVAHRVHTDRTAYRCAGSRCVPREWRAYIDADPRRSTAYTTHVITWCRRHHAAMSADLRAAAITLGLAD